VVLTEDIRVDWLDFGRNISTHSALVSSQEISIPLVDIYLTKTTPLVRTLAFRNRFSSGIKRSEILSGSETHVFCHGGIPVSQFQSVVTLID